MALSDKNIIITPNTSAVADPTIVFTSAGVPGSNSITSTTRYVDEGIAFISFDGSAGELFAISNTISGIFFSVNDISGIPSIEVDDTGLVRLGRFDGNIILGSGIDDGSNKLQMIGNAIFTGQAITNFTTTYVPTGTTQTIDWNNGNVQMIDLESASGNVTLTLSNPKTGASYVLKIQQDGGGGARNIVWPAAVLWAGGIEPIISTENNAIDVIALLYDGTNYFGSFIQNFS